MDNTEINGYQNEIMFAKNLNGSCIIPNCIKMEFTGPPSENKVKNNIANADAIIRLGR